MKNLKFTEAGGDNKVNKLVLFSLSTCGFCSRAKKYLAEEGFCYQYLDVDLLDRESRTVVKEDIKERFTPDILYPFLIINDEEYLSGFDRAEWEKRLK